MIHSRNWYWIANERSKQNGQIFRSIFETGSIQKYSVAREYHAHISAEPKYWLADGQQIILQSATLQAANSRDNLDIPVASESNRVYLAEAPR